MEELTEKFIREESQQAYETAKAKGFFNRAINIDTQMMLVVTEMAEAVQADRHNKHGYIEHLEIYDDTRPFKEAYEHIMEDTVESEFADIAIRLLSLLGYYNKLTPTVYLSDEQLFHRYSIYKYKQRRDTASIPRGLYGIICNSIGNSDISHSPSWIITDLLQDILCQVYALAVRLDIDLLLHIRLKMQYNETREYKHGCKY